MAIIGTRKFDDIDTLNIGDVCSLKTLLFFCKNSDISLSYPLNIFSIIKKIGLDIQIRSSNNSQDIFFVKFVKMNYDGRWTCVLHRHENRNPTFMMERYNLAFCIAHWSLHRGIRYHFCDKVTFSGKEKSVFYNQCQNFSLDLLAPWDIINEMMINDKSKKEISHKLQVSPLAINEQIRRYDSRIFYTASV